MEAHEMKRLAVGAIVDVEWDDGEWYRCEDALAQRLETMQYHSQKLALYRKARKRTDEFWAKEQP